MRGAVVKAVEHRPSLQWNMAHRIILSHKGLDRVEAIEPHQGLELDLAAEIALHQVHVAEARNLPSLDARDYLGADDPLISIGILQRRPAAPETADHQTRIGMRT